MHNQRTQEILDEFEIDYYFEPKFNLEQLKLDAQSIYQNRIEVRLEDTVEEYALCMLDGVDFCREEDGIAGFPSIILLDSGGGGSVTLVDGYQRSYAAREAGVETVSAFVLDAETAPDSVVSILRVRLNAEHGARHTKEEYLQWANYLVEAHGVLLDEAARQCQLKPGALAHYRSQKKATHRLESAGVSKSSIDSIPVNSRSSIANLADDEVINRAVKLVRDYNFTTGMISEMCQSLRELTTHRAKLSRLDELREELAPTIREKKIKGVTKKYVKRPAFNYMVKSVQAVTRIDPKKALTQCESGERDSIKELVKTARTKILDLNGLLSRYPGS